MKKKAIVAVVALAFVLCCVIGGTLAWLVDKTEIVVNTFTYGDINIALEESENLDLKMIPGNTITKDPTITVEKDSEACWLFVKVEKSENFDDFMTYKMADGWTLLAGVDGVYYREVEDTLGDQEGTDFAVLKDNQVFVKNTVLKTELNDLTTETYPKLTFTAYAVQKANIETVEEAWTVAGTNGVPANS